MLLRPSTLLSQPISTNSTRPDVAAIDHDRILSAANRYLELTPTPITTLSPPHHPATSHDYYSEAARTTDDEASIGTPDMAIPDSLAFTLCTGQARCRA